ncbi:hypothetical protein GC197_01305 [bacterium]|nr:hypothetical protein [bacterium]
MVQTPVRKRRAASLLEIILGLPVVLILLFAVVQFGLLQSNQQSLKQASRAGALIAAEFPIDFNAGTPPTQVVTAITEVLQEGGLLGSGETVQSVGAVHLNYRIYDSVNDTEVVKSVSIGSGCQAPAQPGLAYDYVQITICLPATRLAPNTTACFGVDYTGRFVSQTSLFRYEKTP